MLPCWRIERTGTEEACLNWDAWKDSHDCLSGSVAIGPSNLCRVYALRAGEVPRQYLAPYD